MGQHNMELAAGTSAAYFIIDAPRHRLTMARFDKIKTC